jgi:Hypothetical protein FLILHELTA
MLLSRTRKIAGSRVYHFLSDPPLGSSIRFRHGDGLKCQRKFATSRSYYVDEANLGSSSSSPSYVRIIKRTPKFLRPTVSALHNAPVTHITAFLLLHEITAILPLFGLAGAFHYYKWLPTYFSEGQWVVSGVNRFGRYFKRKGWIGEVDETEARARIRQGQNDQDGEEMGGSDSWKSGRSGVRWVVEFATAYAVVKALLPLRIMISVWGAPWFARWTVTPVKKAFGRLFSRMRMNLPSK